MAIKISKGGTICIEKNDTISLKKPFEGSGLVNEKNISEFDLSQIEVGLGWSPQKSFFGAKWDLDAACILLNENGKLEDFDRDTIYYPQSNKVHYTKAVRISEDDTSGDSGADGLPDEVITLELNKLPSKYTRAVFFVSIYNGSSKDQNFSKVDNAFMNVTDKQGREIARFEISDNKVLEKMRSFVFCEFYRFEGDWRMRAIAEGKETDSIRRVAEAYMR